MNKFKIPIILIGVLIFAESAGLIYFTGKSKDLSRKLEAITPGYQKLSQEDLDLKNKFAAITKENEGLKVDRDNVLAQTKSLMGERTRANELTASLEKANQEMGRFQKNNEETKNYILSLKDEIRKLQEEQGSLIQEKNYIKAALDKVNNEATVKELRKKVADLDKAKNSLEGRLKNKNKEVEQLKSQKAKLEEIKEQLSAQIKDKKNIIVEAVNKNKRLEEENKNIPRKFTEMARQNTKLIKDTSEMHYNLGVFYTKNKEYARAVAEFEKVVEIAPDDSYAHFNLGYIYAEYLVNRAKAIEHFRRFLILAKGGDKDIEWVKKYLLTWETYEGKIPMQ